MTKRKRQHIELDALYRGMLKGLDQILDCALIALILEIWRREKDYLSTYGERCAR